MENFTNLLRENNIKVTPQRIAIVELLYIKGHINIDDIFKEIKINFPSISLATIYKNINSMLEAGFINEVKIAKEKSKYEIAKGRHNHIICKECGKVEDLFLEFDNIEEKIKEKTDYEITCSSMNFYGVCPECKVG